MLLRLDCYTRSPEVGHGGLHFLACFFGLFNPYHCIRSCRVGDGYLLPIVIYGFTLLSPSL